MLWWLKLLHFTLLSKWYQTCMWTCCAAPRFLNSVGRRPRISLTHSLTCLLHAYIWNVSMIHSAQLEYTCVHCYGPFVRTAMARIVVVGTSWIAHAEGSRDVTSCHKKLVDRILEQVDLLHCKRVPILFPSSHLSYSLLCNSKSSSWNTAGTFSVGWNRRKLILCEDWGYLHTESTQLRLEAEFAQRHQSFVLQQLCYHATTMRWSSQKGGEERPQRMAKEWLPALVQRADLDNAKAVRRMTPCNLSFT